MGTNPLFFGEVEAVGKRPSASQKPVYRQSRYGFLLGEIACLDYRGCRREGN